MHLAQERESESEHATVEFLAPAGWTLATDDGDALRVLAALTPDHPYERVRRLLTRAAHEGHVSEVEANQIHRQMQQAGFWDVVLPFPEADAI